MVFDVLCNITMAETPRPYCHRPINIWSLDTIYDLFLSTTFSYKYLVLGHTLFISYFDTPYFSQFLSSLELPAHYLNSDGVNKLYLKQ